MSTGTERSLQTTFLADQEAVVVSLKNPLDALNVATFIAYIVLRHAPLMRRLFQRVDPSEDIHPDVTAYLATVGKRPIQIAERMSELDGAWKKSYSQS